MGSDLLLASLLGQVTPSGWWQALTAFALCAVLIPLSLPLARRLKLLDHPAGLKQHNVATPVTGGAIIFIAMLLAGLLFDRDPSLLVGAFFLGAVLIVVVGLLDDRWDLHWSWRLATQILAACVMVIAGVQAEQLHDVFGLQDVYLGLIAIPFTIFIVVGLINAVNMIDGVDGLAGGQALVSLVLLSAFALYAGDVLAAERMLTVAAALIGFLLWNAHFPWQPQARVFLGDAGSMLIGFVIAWYAVALTQNPAHPISPVLGPWTIAIPLIDCVTLMFRRLRQGRSPFSGGRDHLHHMLLDAGFRPAAIAVGLALISLGLGLGAALALKLGIFRPLLVITFLGLLVGYYALTVNRERAVQFFRALQRKCKGNKGNGVTS